MLSQFTRKNKPDSSLDLPRSDGRLLVVTSKPRRFLSKLLKDIIDKTVHDTHSLAGNTDVRVNLLENFEDVDLVSFDAFLGSLLLLIASSSTCFLRKLFAGLWLLLRRRFFCGGLLLFDGLLLSWLLVCLWGH
ncbi:tRNA modification GTPase MnmE [Bienertia sinuspersici]